ncbi:MAG: LLM class F420-dependent oxidoreductase [Clostridiales bacterium]|nr:LLM class F420-dependent oxidoreductase [Clostridiales bacterium]
MSDSVAFGVGIPTGTEGLMYPIPFVRDVRDNIRIAEFAEQLGYDSVWGNDHVASQKYVTEEFGRSPNYYAPLLTLAAIGEHTTRLKLGTALLVLPFRQPGILAKELATLDHLCGGRLRVGVGIGAYREEFESLFGDAARGKNRGAMLDESLEMLHQLFTREEVTFHGNYFQVDHLSANPKPVSNPFPFYIGGNSPAGMRRAARYGTGWLPSGFTVEEMRERVEQLRELLEQQGRSPDALDIAPQFSVALGRTHEEAVEKYRNSQQYKHMCSLSQSTMQGLDLGDCTSRDLIGTPQEILERIEAYREAGVTSFPALLFTANDMEGFLQEMQMFAEDVMSRVES